MLECLGMLAVVVMLQLCGRSCSSCSCNMRSCSSVLTVVVPIVPLRAVITSLRAVIALTRQIEPHGIVGCVVISILKVLTRALGVGMSRALSRQLAPAHLWVSSSTLSVTLNCPQ